MSAVWQCDIITLPNQIIGKSMLTFEIGNHPGIVVRVRAKCRGLTSLSIDGRLDTKCRYLPSNFPWIQAGNTVFLLLFQTCFVVLLLKSMPESSAHKQIVVIIDEKDTHTTDYNQKDIKILFLSYRSTFPA